MLGDLPDESTCTTPTFCTLQTGGQSTDGMVEAKDQQYILYSRFVTDEVGSEASLNLRDRLQMYLYNYGSVYKLKEIKAGFV